MAWQCTKPLCSHEHCPTAGFCNTEGCNRIPHTESEGGHCAAHEAQGWRDELKARWFVNPPDPNETAEAEIQVRRWEAMR
jgi:hypothetical protein